VALRVCEVSFKDNRGVRHTAEVQAESLYEAVILAIRIFRADPWLTHVGPATPLEVAVRESAASHTITLRQVEKWMNGVTGSPNEAVRKTRLRELLSDGNSTKL
jgi:hypothetical protein